MAERSCGTRNVDREQQRHVVCRAKQMFTHRCCCLCGVTGGDRRDERLMVGQHRFQTTQVILVAERIRRSPLQNLSAGHVDRSLRLFEEPAKVPVARSVQEDGVKLSIEPLQRVRIASAKRGLCIGCVGLQFFHKLFAAQASHFFCDQSFQCSTASIKPGDFFGRERVYAKSDRIQGIECTVLHELSEGFANRCSADPETFGPDAVLQPGAGRKFARHKRPPDVVIDLDMKRRGLTD